MQVYSDSSLTKPVAGAYSYTTLNDTSIPQLSVGVAAYSISEGENLIWKISGLIPDQPYYYKITGIQEDDITEDDIAMGLLRGSFKGDLAGNSREISIRTVADQKTEGTEFPRLELFADPSYTKRVNSQGIRLNDTSTTPVIEVDYPSESDEGDSLN